MKSILQEAASIAKAIEKAWQAAGMPEEFTVKVFEVGEKNFFGLVKKPAIISFMYDPRKQSRSLKDQKYSSKNQPHFHDSGAISTGGTRKATGQPSEEAPKYQSKYQGHKDNRQYSKGYYPQDRQNQSQAESGSYYQQEGSEWQPDMLMDISRWLKDMLNILELYANFDCVVEKSVLKIEFDKRVIQETEYEHMLFASLAHLLIQFLKKKYRNQFRGLRIQLSSQK